MTHEKRHALADLLFAMAGASRTGLLDDMAAYASPISITQFCAAMDQMANKETKLHRLEHRHINERNAEGVTLKV